MKQLTTPVLEVVFDIPPETVAAVDFLFKQQNDRNAATILLKSYPEDVTCTNGVYKIPFTVEETEKFEGGQFFYMDTRITDQTGKIPDTPIIRLFMSRTLFTYEEVST